MNYLTVDDPGATAGLVKKAKPSDLYPELEGYDYECPVCKGYGGWHLTLNAYGEGKHFDGHCSQCNGWGWVREEDLCIHEMREISQRECRERGIRHFGMCWHVLECRKCGRIRSYDSSG